jgi:ATP-dependent Clp protease ATP-binding subunit ClpB
MNILLQILDDGKITDSHGHEVNFENTIIVMTTNAGSNLNTAALGFFEHEQKAMDDKTQKALSDFLRPEFLNRVDEIITFRALEIADFNKIAGIMLGDLAEVMADKGLGWKHTEAAVALLSEKAFSTKYGARNLRRLIQTEVEDKIAALVIKHHNTPLVGFALDAVDGAVTVTAL